MEVKDKNAEIQELKLKRKNQKRKFKKTEYGI
jgi:hypothetical protein